MNKRAHSITLDGVAFEGELPQYTSEERPELGPLTRDEDLVRFNRAVASRIVDNGLIGPESFRFCRKVAGMNVTEFAALLDYDRKTVQRWESGELAVPRLPMVIAAFMAREGGREANLHDALKALGEEHSRPSTVDVDAA